MQLEKKRNLLFSTLLFLFLLNSILFAQTPKIEYVLSMDKPYTHYFHVEINIENWTKDSIDLKMPVWTPGSYLVRDFSKNVDYFEASGLNGEKLNFKKIDKNTWRIFNKNEKSIRITYEVYAFELTVRTSFLNADEGYVNGASVFMYADGFKNLPLTLIINPYKDWKQISTGLENVNNNKWKFSASDYDILVDSPIEIGNHKIFHFSVAGVEYQVAMVGRGNYNIDSLLSGLKKMVEAETKVFGENPNKKYVFIVHNTDIPSGGLEHLNSTSLQVNRFVYKPDIRSFLGLAAHEHFHLWNVKRMRPVSLGPFNYNKPNYTTLLWVCEGITDYYSSLVLKRTGLINSDEFLKRLANVINRVKNQPGDSVQSVAMASFDAWIKAYQPDENSVNTTISYYGKGMVLGALLDLEIIKNTNGKKCLDDVMRYMYDEYYKKLKRGYTKEEWKEALEKISGENMDEFFKDYVYGTKPIDYEKYFGYAGVQVLQIPVSNKPFLGISTSEKNDKLIINNVFAGTSAYNYGLNANDEIIAINNFRTDLDIFQKLISTSNVGDTLDFTISRNGVIKNINVVLGRNEQTDITLFRNANMDAQEKLVYNKWLSENLK